MVVLVARFFVVPCVMAWSTLPFGQAITQVAQKTEPLSTMSDKVLNISHVSVAIRLNYGGIVNHNLVNNFRLGFTVQKNLQIDQHLSKLQERT